MPLTGSLSSASETGLHAGGDRGNLATGSKEPVIGDYGSCAGNSDPLSGIQISTFIAGKEAGHGG